MRSFTTKSEKEKRTQQSEKQQEVHLKQGSAQSMFSKKSQSKRWIQCVAGTTICFITCIFILTLVCLMTSNRDPGSIKPKLRRERNPILTPNDPTFPTIRPPEVSPSLFSLMKKQHDLLPKILQKMNSKGPASYVKSDCYAWYAYPTDYDGGCDPARPKTRISDPKELKQALDPQILGDEWVAVRTKDIDCWIEIINFTADALEASNFDISANAGDSHRIVDFVNVQKEYSMLKHAPRGRLTPIQYRYRKAFIRLRKIIRKKRWDLLLSS